MSKTRTEQTAPQQRTTPQLEGIVKAVPSGDTLVLAHPAKPIDKTLTLASISAPRLARRGEEKEEPFAFEAREFLRKKCIGKKVKFQVEYTNPKTGRDYGSVFLDDENLGESLLAQGLAELKAKNEKNQDESYKRLLNIVEEAKSNKLGLYQDDVKKNYKARKVVWADKDFNAEAKLKSFKGKPVDVIVEHVINGSSLRILLPTNEMVVLHLTGVQAPGFKWEDQDSKRKGNKDAKTESPRSPAEDGESGEEKGKRPASRMEVAQPFAKEARYYTEMRLLHREVTVLFESIDKFNNFFGTIITKEDESSKQPVTFQEELLLKGLAKLSEWSAARSKYLPRLRAAENQAKQQQLCVWKGYKAPAITLTQGDTKEFMARVVDVISGDTLRIKADGENEDDTISLSSIRTPRMGRKEEPAEPWAFEAREALKRLVAGKKVTVRVDYRKSLGSNKDAKEGERQSKQEERRMCTILVGGKSVAVELAKEGLASVIRHKADEERSLFYDQLMMAEADAEKKGKGKHGSIKKAPKHQIKDLTSEEPSVARQFSGMFKDKQTKGTIEKVLSGTRFKVYLPTHSMIVNFSLSGLTSPAPRPKGDQPVKPFAREAQDFSIDNLLFRDVELNIEDIDEKSGTFVGDLFIKGENYAIKILEHGYAMLQRAASKKKNFNELKQAEAKAKGSHKEEETDDEHPYPNGINIWSVAPSVYRSANQKSKPERRERVVQKLQVLGGESYQARVTAIVDIEKFYMQTAAAEADLAHLDEKVRPLNLDQQEPLSAVPKPGTLVFAKYSVDNAWYRAKVVEEGAKKEAKTAKKGGKDKRDTKKKEEPKTEEPKKEVSKDTKVTVFYVDFGNTETVELKSLRKLDPNDDVGKIGFIAQKCALAFVVPDKVKFREDANQYFRDYVEDNDLEVTFEYKYGDVTYVTLQYDKESLSVNQALLNEGLVFLDNSLRREKNAEALIPKLDALQPYVDAAKKDFEGLWGSADVYDDDDF